MATSPEPEMARCFDSSRIFCNNGSGLAQRQQIQKTPAGNRQQARQPPVQRLERQRTSADPSGHDRNGWKDAAPVDELETSTAGQVDVLGGRPIARVFVFRGGSNQAA